MARFLNYLNKFLKNTHAVSVIEYGVGAALITIAIFVASQQMGQRNVTTYEKIGSTLNGHTP